VSRAFHPSFPSPTPVSVNADLILHVILEIREHLHLCLQLLRLVPGSTELYLRRASEVERCIFLSSFNRDRLTRITHRSTLFAAQMDVKTGELLPKKPVNL